MSDITLICTWFSLYVTILCKRLSEAIGACKIRLEEIGAN